MKYADVDLMGLLDGLAGEAAALLRSHDWSKTPLGPLETWPRSLASHVLMVLELPSPAIIFWGPEQTQIYNDGYALIMGPRHPRFWGAPVRECWPDTYPVVHPWMEKVLRTGQPVTVEKSLIPVTRYGFEEEAYFTFTFSPLRDDRGAIAGIYQPVVEVTDTVLSERRAETLQALEPRIDSRDATRDVIDALSANRGDLPFTVLYLWDEASKRLELAAATGALLDAELPLAALARVARRAFDANQKLEIEASDELLGHGFGVWPKASPLAQALPLPDRASTPRGVIVFGINPRLHFDNKYRSFLEVAAGQVASALSSARILQDTRNRAEALAEIDRAKTIFLSNISHEFRTPLTLMLGPLEDELAVAGRPLSREDLDAVRRNARRLLGLVDTLLDFSRVEAGRAEATYQPTDLAALTTELASAFRSAAKRAGLRFVVDCPPLDESVYVDHAMWEKIVLNLLSNALNFTLEGAIEVSLTRVDDHVVLRVADTGVGVAPAQIPRLFQPFHRVHDSRARSQQGSGIGLALVRQLVRLHGGAIEVESTEGIGSTFTVTLPLGSSHLPAEHVGGAAPPTSRAPASISLLGDRLRRLPELALPASTVAAPSPAAARPLSSPAETTVLVVDDDLDMREYLHRLLATRWSVDTAEDGVSALTQARERPPQLVLTDVMMPRMDGFGLLEALRADDRTRAIPVVMLSARAGEEARIEGLRAGADDYLVKPFSARELLARVESQLELSRLRAAAALERNKLHDLFMNAPAMICVLGGPDHVFELANPLYQQLVGRRDLVGRTIREALPEIAGQGFFELLDEVYQRGVPCAFSETLVQIDRAGDGELEDAYLNFVYQPSLGTAGQVEGILVFAFDVSEQVRARQQVQDVQDRMSFALEAAGVGYWDLDTSTRRAMGSPSHDAIFGYDSPVPEWTIESFLSHIVPEERDRVAAALEHSLQTGEELLVECPISRADGAQRWILARGRSDPSPTGAPGRMLGVVLDVTERKQAETEREARLDDLARTVHFSELFVGIVSHDLRSPLAAIMTAAELLESDATDAASVATSAMRIVHSAERMRRIIDQLLDFTRIRLGGGIPLQRRRTDLEKLCRLAVDELVIDDEDSGIELSSTGATFGHWDPDRLAQLVSNLLGNALEHRSAGATVQVRIDGSDRDTVRLEVHNQGNIPAELLPDLFEPFRGTAAASRGARGLGLGLFIARQIALAHGGRVEVESSEAAGTSFTVELPRHRTA